MDLPKDPHPPMMAGIKRNTLCHLPPTSSTSPLTVCWMISWLISAGHGKKEKRKTPLLDKCHPAEDFFFFPFLPDLNMIFAAALIFIWRTSPFLNFFFFFFFLLSCV